MTEVVEAKDKIDVYIPGSLVPGYQNYCPIARFDGHTQEDGTVKIRLQNGEEMSIQKSQLIENPGFLVLEIRGIVPEHTVNSAAYAIYQSLSSMFASCGMPVDYERIRTMLEFTEYLKTYRHNYSHIVLIGHGTEKGVQFLDRQTPTAGQELSGCLGGDSTTRSLEIISLCCHSGGKQLSEAISKAVGVSSVIGPTATFDMRWAVHFVTGYFLYRYLENRTADQALKGAVVNANVTPMCVWRNGVVSSDCV
jgi:hypothetical protein